MEVRQFSALAPGMASRMGATSPSAMDAGAGGAAGAPAAAGAGGAATTTSAALADGKILEKMLEKKPMMAPEVVGVERTRGTQGEALNCACLCITRG